MLDDGSAWTVGRVPRWPPAEGEHGRMQDVVSSVVTLLEQNAEAIRDGRPRTRFNRCGYLLHDVLDAEQLDLARLLIGSEGTLGLFTEIELRTLPLPAGALRRCSPSAASTRRCGPHRRPCPPGRRRAN